MDARGDLPMLTLRGVGLLVVAIGAYIGGRLVGTYELYLVAFSLAALVVLALAYVLTSSRRLTVRRILDPPTLFSGDEASLSLELTNPSFLPTSPLRVQEQLRDATGSDVILELPPQPPRGSHRETVTLPPARRGVYVLPPSRVTLSDPLGIASWGHDSGVEEQLVVLPRIVRLRSCVLFGVHQLGAGARSRSSLAHTSLELRSVRPHQPGEPLSRIDWKSTAKTGVLMLREVEEPARSDVLIALEGTAAGVVGTAPDTSYELAVAAVGTLGDYVLSEGYAVDLLSHGAQDRVERYEGHAEGGVGLLRALAETQPEAATSFAAFLRGHYPALTRGVALVVVTAVLDDDLFALLAELHGRGLPVSVVLIEAQSFRPRENGSDGQPRPSDSVGPRAHPEPPLSDEPIGSTLDVATKRRLLRLQAVGIVSLTIARSTDLEAALAAPHHVFTGTAR
jgi:uncharacterized protein (DUF58 family)